MAKREESRCRNWSFILYPESAPAEWLKILDDNHIRTIVSPLHDKDKNDDGTEKKSHYHIILLFEGLKSYEQVKSITDSLNQPIPQRIQSIQGMVRYLIHADNPEKYQYNKDEIITTGGARIDTYFNESEKSDTEILREVCNMIRSNKITEYSDLIEIALDQDSDDYLKVISGSHSYFISQYIHSLRNKYKSKEERAIYVNPDTGEIL